MISKESSLKDLIQNFTPVNPSERLQLLLKYSLSSLQDPTKADYVAAVGDLSSVHTLKEIRRKMHADIEGQQILKEKPRVNSETWNKQRLLALPDHTFGHQFARWMKEKDFSSDERPITKYVPDLELAYVMQRYREIHDTLHVLLGYDVTVAEEIAVKWYEMIQLGLPSTALSAFVGPLNLLAVQRNFEEFKLLNTVYLPHILQQSQTSGTFFMNIYFEKHFETDIRVLRQRLGIRPLKKQISTHNENEAKII
eukprot:403353374